MSKKRNSAALEFTPRRTGDREDGRLEKKTGVLSSSSAVDSASFEPIGRRGLSVEISELLQYVRIHKAEMRCREDVRRRVLHLAQSIWPEARMEIFGSHGSATEHYDSDLDLRLREIHMSPSSACFELKIALGGTDWADRVEARPRARVPIVCFRDVYTGVSVDVSFGCTVDRVLDTSSSRDWFSGSAKIFFDLVLLMKLYLKIMGLDKPFTGGLGSFRLAVLLQEFLAAKNYSQQDDITIEVLTQLLQFMASEFDYFHRTLFASNGRQTLRVTYGNVDVYLLRTTCLNALHVLQHQDENNQPLLLPCIFTPSAFTAIQTARLKKLRLAKAYVKTHLTTAAIPPPSSYFNHQKQNADLRASHASRPKSSSLFTAPDHTVTTHQTKKRRKK